MKDKPKNGSLSFKNGKATIVWNNREQKFGIAFIIEQMRKGVSQSHQGAYVKMVRKCCTLLDKNGMFAIKDVQKELKLLKCSSDINRKWVDMILGWINYVNMFKNVKTGKKEDSPSKKFVDNWDNIFKDPVFGILNNAIWYFKHMSQDEKDTIYSRLKRV